LNPKTRTYASESQAHAKPPLYGQPISTTHPHLIKNNADLTRGIPASEYEARRRNLMQSLPEGSKVICMGGTVKLVTQRKSLRSIVEGGAPSVRAEPFLSAHRDLVSNSSGEDETNRLIE